MMLVSNFLFNEPAENPNPRKHNLKVEAYCRLTKTSKEGKKKCDLQKKNYVDWLDQVVIGICTFHIVPLRSNSIYEINVQVNTYQ
jgi:hypothetical protein